MDMKLLREYSEIAPAYIDKGYLESEGIRCKIQQDAMGSILPGAWASSAALYVDANQYNEAVKLMNGRK